MNDAFFYVVAFVCLFILWVVSGGPTRPISFAGAFITPITNEGQTQSGYGPKVQLNETISATGSSAGVGLRTGAFATGIPDTSSYAGKVILAHSVGGSGTDPEQEYITLEVPSGTTGSIDISGWKLVSTVTGASAVIPEGVQRLNFGTVTLQPIALSEGNSATVTTGDSPVNVSFEQNECSNYLSQASSYNSCVTAHQNDSGYLSGIWRVYLNQNARLWKSSGDTIELVDSNGKVVDSFSN